MLARRWKVTETGVDDERYATFVQLRAYWAGGFLAETVIDDGKLDGGFACFRHAVFERSGDQYFGARLFEVTRDIQGDDGLALGDEDGDARKRLFCHGGQRRRCRWVPQARQ